MSEEFNRVRLDKSVTHQLRRLHQVTGLTPNYLARIGLCYSLNEPRPPSSEAYDAEGKEINRYTLLGDQEPLYMALVRKRMLNEGRDSDEELYPYFVAHLNRGVESLSGRVSDLTDLYTLLPGELKAQE